MSTDTQLTFEPVVGVVVFKKDHRHYLQVHNIEKKNEKFVWAEGKPFQREQLQELALSLRNEQVNSLKLKGIIPDNVLYFHPAMSGSKFCWFVPPQRHYITFTSEVKIPTGNYRFPGLIMAADGKDLYIFAYKGLKKPDAKTELFHAPFYNVYGDGEVCMGTISESRRKAFLDEEIDRWQRRFFGGRFTLAHGEDGRVPKGVTFKDLYRSMKGPVFPEKNLKPMNKPKTLSAFIKTLAEGGDNE